ncbi:MAG: hypothetical protein LUG65_02105 [Clostridiales bacterium]|nr:hypothetical protein [Clostridiales bacterium]
MFCAKDREGALALTDREYIDLVVLGIGDYMVKLGGAEELLLRRARTPAG